MSLEGVRTEKFFESDHFEKILERHPHLFLQTMEKLIGKTEEMLGKGTTAEVHFLGHNPRVCIKIMTPETIKPGVLFFNNAQIEGKFTKKAKEASKIVNVPKVFLSIEADRVSKDSGEKEPVSILMMETINAVSIDDVLQGRAPLPENFNIDTFFAKIMDFLEEIHDQDLYHRDLHEGNIMIDRVTGEPWVIDFGAATTSFGEDDPYLVNVSGQTTKLISDESVLKRVKKDLKEHLARIGK